MGFLLYISIVQCVLSYWYLRSPNNYIIISMLVYIILPNSILHKIPHLFQNLTSQKSTKINTFSSSPFRFTYENSSVSSSTTLCISYLFSRNCCSKYCFFYTKTIKTIDFTAFLRSLHNIYLFCTASASFFTQ